MGIANGLDYIIMAAKYAVDNNINSIDNNLINNF